MVEAVESARARSIPDLQRLTRAGTGCGTCHRELEEVLADFGGSEIPKLQRLENKRLCRSETEQRVEASLYSGILPKLPPGTKLELVSVSGLTIDLHLAPDPPELRELVREKLRKYICEQLEVEFS